MSTDITYCTNKKCNYKMCKRHPNCVKSSIVLHSFADLDGTEYCIKSMVTRSVNQNERRML